MLFRSAALNIAWTLASSGDLKKAQETLQPHKDTLGRIAPVVGLEGYLAAAQGQHDLAIALEAELTSLAKAKPYSSGFFERALIAHALGQSARARSLFQMSLHAQESSAFLGRLEPLLAPLTRDAAEPESRS